MSYDLVVIFDMCSWVSLRKHRLVIIHEEIKKHETAENMRTLWDYSLRGNLGATGKVVVMWLMK